MGNKIHENLLNEYFLTRIISQPLIERVDLWGNWIPTYLDKARSLQNIDKGRLTTPDSANRYSFKRYW